MKATSALNRVTLICTHMGSRASLAFPIVLDRHDRGRGAEQKCRVPFLDALHSLLHLNLPRQMRPVANHRHLPARSRTDENVGVIVDWPGAGTFHGLLSFVQSQRDDPARIIRPSVPPADITLK
jgi:hypothetical protein